MAQITYDDKELVDVNPLPEINKFTADNANEIKTVVNAKLDKLRQNWDFPAGAFPTMSGIIYKTTAEYLTNGEAGYLPVGCLMLANTLTPSTREDFDAWATL